MSDFMTDRQCIFKKDTKSSDSEPPFRVVSYNITAQLEDLGGGATPCSDAAKQQYHKSLMKELQFLDAAIFCFQSISVDYWDELETNLTSWGYCGVQVNRRPGPLQFRDAVFFLKVKFDLVSNHGIPLDDLITEQLKEIGDLYHPDIRDAVASREVVVLITLRCKSSHRMLRIANTRCVSVHNKRSDLQALQVCAIMKAIAKMDDNLPTLLCGFLDFTPQQAPFQVMKDGYMNNCSAKSFDKIKSIVTSDNAYPLSVIYRVGFKHEMTTMRSAYTEIMGWEPPNAWRKDGGIFDCRSYILFDQSKLEVIGVLDKVASEAITENGLPSDTFPSASLSLMAVFMFGD